MTEPRAYTVVRLTRVVSSFLIALGTFGLLRTFAEDVSSDETVTVFKLVVHPASCAVYLVLGMVGVLAGTTAGRSQRFLGGLAGIMVLWALLGQVLRGTPDDAFSGATSVLLLHLGIALVAGGAVWLPERATAAPIAAPDTTVPVEEIPAPAHVRLKDEDEASAGEGAARLAPEADRP